MFYIFTPLQYACYKGGGEWRYSCPYHTWLAFLGCELNHLTLEQEAVVIGRTVTTCFNMRHILYSAVSKKVMSIRLSGITELDATYTKINLKGTKAKNMPRISKERGKHKTSLLGKNLAGVSHHNQHTSSSGIFRLDHNMQGSEVYDRSKEKILRCIHGYSISKTNVNYIKYLLAASASIFI
jgi:hypothetical protein